MRRKSFLGILSLGIMMIMASCGGTKKTAGGPVAFNETGFPIVNEPLTLRVIARKSDRTMDYNELPVFKRLEEKTGIHIEWEYTDADWSTKKPLVLAGGDLPDVFFGIGALNESDVIGNMGLFVQLDPLIEKYGVNIKAMYQDDPNMVGFSKAYDGNIYGLPQKMPVRPANYSVMAINQLWLDKLNLKTPTTTEEFYTTLKAFKERDPNGNGIADEIPWSLLGFSDLPGCMELFCAFGVVESQFDTWLSVTNGKVQYIAAQDGFSDAVAYLHRLYAEGLIDQEAFTMDWNMWAAKCIPSGDAPEIVGVGSHWVRFAIAGMNRVDHYPLLMPLKGPKGHQFWRQSPELTKGGKYALEIASSCKNPEIAFRWADAVYDEIVGLELYYGAIGLVLQENSDGTYLVLPPPPGQDNDQWIWGNSMGDLRPGYASDKLSARISDPDQKEQIDDKIRLSAYYPKEWYPPAVMTPDEASELATLRTDIHGFAQERTATWIVNGGVEQEYAGFVRQLETMGLRRMEAIYQGAYNRYMGR
jgi:putative aldouronate transport system substrate-binding protein